jgi:5-methylcytosine-specific restriction endonuclease McrA
VLQKSSKKASRTMSNMRRAVLQVNRTYEPLRIISARQALKLVTKGKAKVIVPTDIQVYPDIFLPSVIRLVTYAKVPYKKPIPSRKNIFVRDGFRCLYCGARAPKAVLELEHIVPKSKGGPSSWENLCAACHPCNQKKGDKTLEESGMTLIHRPLPASIHTARFVLKQLGEEVNEWAPYLWNDSRGEQKLQFA